MAAPNAQQQEQFLRELDAALPKRFRASVLCADYIRGQLQRADVYFDDVYFTQFVKGWLAGLWSARLLKLEDTKRLEAILIGGREV
jgi:hypothetical protein